MDSIVQVPYRSSISNSTSELDKSIARNSVEIRAWQSVHSGPIVVIGASLCGIAFALAGGGWPSLFGALIIVLGALINRKICQSILTRPEPSDAESLAKDEVTMWWLTVMNTTSVGVWIWLVGIASSKTELLFVVTMVQSMYSLGALINASTHPPTFIAGTWMNFGLMVVFWLTQGASGVAAAVSLVGLGLLLGKFSGQIHREFATSVEIRFENASLLERLQRQVQIADAARASAEEANQSKSKFLAAASHDLRQPLHSLMLFTGLLESGSASERGGYMQHIRSAADSLDALFTGLLDLSKLDSGAAEVTLLDTNLEKLLTPIAKEFEAVAIKKKLQFAWQLPSCTLRTDPYLLERIARNLLDNAFKYTDSGSVFLELVIESDHATLEVADTGPGIPVNEHEQIFSEFHRVGGRSGSSVAGSGLGLAIVKRLCDTLGYRIALESTLGEGSKFVLTMPFSGVEENILPVIDSESEETRVSQLPREATVIIIDDDASIRTAMVATIELMGAKALPYASGELLLEALEAGLENEPDAILADFRLPGEIDGIKAIATLRSRYPDLPAAIISGDIHTYPDFKGLLGGDTFFRKPVSQKVIIAWLKEVLL